MADNERDQKVTINLEEHRPEGATTWELPAWGHALSLGVFPLHMVLDNSFIPIGTAFCISRIGIVATASHNLLEALKRHPRGQQILQERWFPKNVELKNFGDAGFSLLHARWVSKETFHVNFWPLEGASGLLVEEVDGKQPADLIFGSPQFQQDFPYLPLPISFAIPRVGSNVRCVGYSRTDVQGGKIPIEDLRQGRIGDWFKYYSHSFRVVEGTVTEIFTQGFARGYLRGACFAIDAEVEHGQSGGPVFNDEGYVCGVISASASSYFGRPASLISLFYPAMAIGVSFGFSMGPVRMDATHPLFAFVENGSIRTDGSEELVSLVPEGNSWRVGPMIHKDDGGHVFDDFGGHQDSRPATPGPDEFYRLRRRNHVDQGIDAKEIDPAANEIADQGLGDTE
jgi:Trypsin-like peptidase domain